MVNKGRTIQQRTPPWWSRLPVSSGMAIDFPAAQPRQPLRKGLTEGGVEGFNSLPAIGTHERQLFDKLLWGLVTSTIFVRC